MADFVFYGVCKMFDYIKFRTTAYKHKYDTVLDTPNKRISYGELNSAVNALYNSLMNMGISGRALVMLGNTPEFVTSCLALSKAGFEVMLVSPLVSSAELKAAYTAFEPSFVIATGEALNRLNGTLLQLGCITAVAVGNAQNVFPAQFDYDSLLASNDYRLVNTAEAESGNFCFFYQSEINTPELPEVDAAFLLLPLCEKQGAALLSQLIYNGGRCILGGEVNKKTVKKKKADALFVDPSLAYMYSDIGCKVYTFEFSQNLRRCGDRLVDVALVSKHFTELCRAPVTISFSGVRLHITLTLDGNASKENVAEHPAVKAVKAAAGDLLFAIPSPKTFSVKKTV